MKHNIFLVCLIIIIFLFSFLITVLLKNKDLITKDPIVYGMTKHNFSSCTCYGDGVIYTIGPDGSSSDNNKQGGFILNITK